MSRTSAHSSGQASSGMPNAARSARRCSGRGTRLPLIQHLIVS
jgi:hypothetical protein